jgi:exodeoxyribonuclease VII small subunit
MAPKKEVSYNEAIREVEAILEKLNREEPDVDQLGELVKRAVELISLCKEKLHTAEEEVAKVIRKEEDN